MLTSPSGCRFGGNAGLVSFQFGQLTTPSFALDIHRQLAPSRVRTILPFHFHDSMVCISSHFSTFHRKYLVSGFFRIISTTTQKSKTLKVNIPSLHHHYKNPATIRLCSPQLAINSYSPTQNLLVDLSQPVRRYLRYSLALLWLASSVPRCFADAPLPEKLQAFLSNYCFECHDGDVAKADLDLQSLSKSGHQQHTEEWEKVIRRLRTRQMPPPDKKRPDEPAYAAAVTELTAAVDRLAEAQPNPGRTETLRRLNRTEYQNAIRDLLDLKIDAAALLPKDEAGHGFDNVTVGDLSPTLLERYISAAQKISRQAIGARGSVDVAETFRVRPDLTQEHHMSGLPLGTRGGTVISYDFPAEATYEIQVRLTRDRNEDVEGLTRPHELHMLVDDEVVGTFTILPPSASLTHEKVDEHLKLRTRIAAGPHALRITFPKTSSSLAETRRQPYQARFNVHRHPRQAPAVYQVSLTGAFDPIGPGPSPSRARIFPSYPNSAEEEETAARNILLTLARRAYRQPINEEQLNALLKFFNEGKGMGGFEAGIERAIAAILVNPLFLFRIETDPEPPVTSPYKIAPLELASRLSFFLWSSIPDDELLDAALRGDLHNPDLLAAQVRRMLQDGRAESIVGNFASQWLHLRNLDSIAPDARLFPDFDHNLREAMRTETELFIYELFLEDKSVLDLLRANHTFLNERLAKHYGVPHVYGSHFRKVTFPADSKQGGLLRHASILTVTSYATRTSPVIRGNWILANFIGTPAPPPPPNVPSLQENTPLVNLPMRTRLAKHRENAACASCHNAMDPIGFTLENFDAIGRWREMEEEQPIDTAGGLPDGSSVQGIAELQQGLLSRPEDFVHTLTEKLMTFALGRGIEYYDQPAIRKIVADARAADYCFSSIILGIVQSKPFTMRMPL